MVIETDRALILSVIISIPLFSTQNAHAATSYKALTIENALSSSNAEYL